MWVGAGLADTGQGGWGGKGCAGWKRGSCSAGNRREVDIGPAAAAPHGTGTFHPSPHPSTHPSPLLSPPPPAPTSLHSVNLPFMLPHHMQPPHIFPSTLFPPFPSVSYSKTSSPGYEWRGVGGREGGRGGDVGQSWLRETNEEVC